MKPSHFRTPRNLQECKFTRGYKSWDYKEEAEQTKSWLLLLGIFLSLTLILSLFFSS